MKSSEYQVFTISWDKLSDMIVEHERTEKQIVARRLRELGVSWKIITEATGVRRDQLPAKKRQNLS